MKLLTSDLRLSKRILVTAGLVAVVVWIWAGDEMPAQPFCVFHRLTGIPCWGCGTVRVVQLLIQGKIMDAFLLNPLSVLACVMIVVGTAIWWIDFFRNTHVMSSLMRKKVNPLTIIVLVSLVLLNWMWNIQKGL